jgi:hypothetical protein
MSLKIFLYQLFGKIKPVEKIESQRHSLYNDYLEYQRIERSEELKEFTELEEYVNSEEFKNKKAEIKNSGFKGSKEEELQKEYEKLKNANHIKKYFKVKSSSDMRRFETLKDSHKMKEYHELYEYMDNGSFAEEKEEICSQVYKGSDEEEQEKEYDRLKRMPLIKAYLDLHDSKVLSHHEKVANSDKLKKYFELKNLPEKDKEKKKEFKSLKRNSEIKNYLKLENSKKFRLYRDSVDSYHLERFLELNPIVESKDFKKRVSYLKDKKKFEKTEAHKKWKRLKELSASKDIKFYLKFEKSRLLKNYYDVSESADLKRFWELKEIVTSQDFLKRKAYLKDSRKWEKSEEHAKELKYHEMKRRPHLVKFFKYKGTDAFDFFKEWRVSFDDDFSENKIDPEKWSVQSLWADKTLGRNYSLPGDLQVFTSGENILCSGKLVIETRKEKSEGMVWQMPAGFVPGEFDYTSGMVSTGKSYWQKDGIFEAKIKFNPVKEVVSSFILQGEKNSPRVHLLEMGIKNRIGISNTDNKGKLKMEGLDISSLKKGKWYIFSLEKSGNVFTWKINETEILRLENSSFNSPLHINLFSIVVNQIPRSKLPVRFNVNWVKCYQKL